MLTSDMLDLGRLASLSESVKLNHLEHGVDLNLAESIKSQLDLIIQLKSSGHDYSGLAHDLMLGMNYLNNYWHTQGGRY